MKVHEKPIGEQYLDAKYVVDNPNGFDHRDVARAQEYVNGFDGALFLIKMAIDDEKNNWGDPNNFISVQRIGQNILKRIEHKVGK